MDTELNTGNPFHILALSGGGYKGLYTAQVIAQIEERTGKPFGSHFDLICGTSVGGLIALALATREIPALNIVKTLQDAGPRIFSPIELPKRKLLATPKTMARVEADRLIYKKSGFTLNRGVTAAKHNSAPLKDALVTIFGDRKIEDLKTRVLIPSANWTKGGPQFFKTPHNPMFTLDKKRTLVDVAMATSAAPIYLPNYEFEHQVYIDGGIVGNAPGIFGVHEAEHAIDADVEKDIRLLSIGALSSKTTANQSETLDKGLAQWNSRIFDFMMACQEQTANFMMKQKMGNHYYMIDISTSADQDKVVALDKADVSATNTLLGLAKISFQDEIAKEPLNTHLDHQAPDLCFKSQKEL
ncbi:MAG: CBASS cGAMP-activated phospholipase [Gammaproteobacteria bacterium]